MDTIVLKGKGGTYQGTLLHKSFTIITPDGRVRVPKAKIAQMLINVSMYGGQDVMYTYGSQLVGEIVEDPVLIRLADSGDRLKVPQNKILAIHVG